MKFRENLLIMLLGMGCFFLLFACQQQESVQANKVKPEMSEGELSTDVPALHDLHGVVYPLWHDAFPEKDYALIKELLPEADSLTQRLDETDLPGILRDKKMEWDKGKENLKNSLQELHRAVEENDQDGILAQVEAFHSAFERLVRIIRPVVPELEAFHQEMYKLYHYYMPNYERDDIRSTVAAMQEKLVALKEVRLPQRLAEKQEQYDAAVNELALQINNLAEVVKQENRDLINSAVEKVHNAYRQTEAVFD